jgi:hypothetical protein
MNSINQNSDSEAFSKKLQAIIPAVKNREKITLDERKVIHEQGAGLGQGFNREHHCH